MSMHRQTPALVSNPGERTVPRELATRPPVCAIDPSGATHPDRHNLAHVAPRTDRIMT